MKQLAPHLIAQIDLHALSMEQCHTYEPCEVHEGCCIIHGPYEKRLMAGPGANHVAAFQSNYKASEQAARALVRHYAALKTEREIRGSA